MQTVVLLTISNIFKTFAWYGQSQIHSPPCRSSSCELFQPSVTICLT